MNFDYMEIKTMRKESVIKRNLDALPISKNIEIPDILGHFKDDKTYLKTIEILSASTKEYDHRLNYIKSSVLPNIPHPNFFLDIGPGNGKLTQEIMKNFEYTTLIDTNKEVLENSKFRAFSPHKINKSIFDVSLEVNKYDFINLSHTLYHIEKAQWKTLVKKLEQSLKEGGILFISYNDGLTRGELIKKASPFYLDFENFIEEISMEFIVNHHRIKERVITKNLEEMIHIINLFLADSKCKLFKEEAEEFAAKNLYKLDKGYILWMYQHFLTIKK